VAVKEAVAARDARGDLVVDVVAVGAVVAGSVVVVVLATTL
jgi:hypothetical protein